MKKVMTLLFLLAMMALCMAGCGTEKEETVPTDTDFIDNLQKAVEARWALNQSSQYNETAISGMSVSEQQKAYTLFVDTELEKIGNLDDYDFQDASIKELAETYVKGLNLQKEGVQYQGTEKYTEQSQTWGLGYDYRVVALVELYNNHGFTVNEKYKSEIEDFVSVNSQAKEDIAIQDFVDDLSENINYSKDEENSDEWSTYYTAIIENTTEYPIDSLALDISFVDKDGVVVYQTSDYLQNIKAGSKVRSSVYYDSTAGDFETIECTPTVYRDN